MVRTIFEFRDGSSIAVILPLHTPIRDPGSSGWARAGSTVLPAITTRPARRQRRRSKNLPVRPLGSPQRATTHTELWGDWHGVMERPPSTSAGPPRRDYPPETGVVKNSARAV